MKKWQIGCGGLAALLAVCGLWWALREPSGAESASGRATGKEPAAAGASLSPANGEAKSGARKSPKGPSGSGFDFGFEAADFEATWEKALGGSSEAQRTAMLVQVVGRMSQLGKADIAVAKVVESFGPGSTRSTLIGVAFSRSTDRSAWGEIYGRLQFDDERQTARLGMSHAIGDTLARNGDAFEFRLDEVKLPDAEKAQILADSAERYVMTSFSKSRENSAIAFTDLMGGNLPESTRRDLVVKLSPLLPFECWEEFQSKKLKIEPKQAFDMVSRMVSAEPERSLEKMAANKTDGSYLAAGLNTWLGKDMSKALDWYESHRSNLSQEQQDRSCQIVALYAARNGDMETAKAWINQISDKAIKGEAGSFISPKGETGRKTSK